MRTLTRSVAAIVLAAIVAAGCGTTDEASNDAGPLRWLPADTWLLATANLDPKQIDEGVAALDRLPIWALAEGYLPASDGAGLRRALLEQLAEQATSGAAKVTAKQLETAFGHRAGMAITAADPSAIDGDEPPFAAWVEIDDEDAALSVAKDLFAGSDSERDHEGVTYFHSKADDVTFLVRDGLLVVSSSPEQMERLIEVREGDVDGSLADDETAAAVLEAGVGDALAGFAIASEPLLDAAPELVREQARNIEQDGEASADAKDAAERATKAADELGAALASNAVDGLVADWVAGSATIDTSGVRVRGAWSNPRDLADPDPGSRELVERMPADVPIVAGSVSDGAALGRVQDAWREVRDAYDLDLRDVASAQCPAGKEWACDLGIELALAVLEDEDLAQAMDEQGDTTSVMTQDVTPLLGALAAGSTDAAAAPKAFEARLYEVVTSAANIDWEPPAGLTEAARAAGLLVSTSPDGLRITIRVRPGSPLQRMLATELDPAGIAALASMGLDVRELTSPAGLTITAQQVDGLQVAGLPQDARSKVVPALEGDADTLADSSTYDEVVAAAKPPKQVGGYGWVDLAAYVDGVFTALGQGDQDVQRMIPTIRNNLADVPGIVMWTTREDVDGEQVGVYELTLPILE